MYNVLLDFLTESVYNEKIIHSVPKRIEKLSTKSSLHSLTHEKH